MQRSPSGGSPAVLPRRNVSRPGSRLPSLPACCRQLTPGLAAVALLLTGAAHESLAGDWQPFGLQGTTIRSLAAAPGVLCAGTQADGVYCRDLTGLDDQWRPRGLAGPAITWLWIDPVNVNVIFAAIGESFTEPARLYRSLDGGTSWAPADGDLTHPPYAVHGVPDSTLVYGAGWGVWRSTNLGATWTQMSQRGGLWSLDVAPTDADTVWDGGETVIFMGFTEVSTDGGLSWSEVWNSGSIGDNQTADIAAHPEVHGLVLTGHEGFVLRTLDTGANFDEVLTAPARFFLDWDGGNRDRAYASGSPNSAGGLAYVSRDRGATWIDVTADTLVPRLVFRLAADASRVGVAYVATDDGIYRFYGGGLPLCLDLRDGLDTLRLWAGACSAAQQAEASPASTLRGDAIALELASLAAGPLQVDLGPVECLMQDVDISLATLDLPEPAAGRVLGVLARRMNDTDYGDGSQGLPRIPSGGDCD